MKKPRKQTGGARIALRLRQDELDKLDAKVARMQAEMPAFKLTRSDVARAALAEFVEKR